MINDPPPALLHLDKQTLKSDQPTACRMKVDSDQGVAMNVLDAPFFCVYVCFVHGYMYILVPRESKDLTETILEGSSIVRRHTPRFY